jgi:hypothetical protein
MGKAAVVEEKCPPDLVGRGMSDMLPRFRRGSDDGMWRSNPTQHGKPRRWRRVTANETPARDKLGRAR